MKNKNIPNYLTILRVILIPFFVVAVLLIPTWDFMKYVALGIYVFASLTDFVDGYLARKYNVVSDFGKLMDPLADKLLVATGLILLSGLGVIPSWVTVILIGRDFVMDAVRMLAVTKGVIMAAGMYGKAKTPFQMVGISLALIDNMGWFGFIEIFKSSSSKLVWSELLINILMSLSISLAVIFSIVSCIKYITSAKFNKKEDEEPKMLEENSENGNGENEVVEVEVAEKQI